MCFSSADLFALGLRVHITQGSPSPNFSSAAIFSSAGILVPLKFSSILVLLIFLHLHLGSPMSEGHPKDFSSAGTFNFSSAGTFLHLNAISYAFSSAGTFLHLNAISYVF